MPRLTQLSKLTLIRDWGERCEGLSHATVLREAGNNFLEDRAFKLRSCPKAWQVGLGP